MHTVSLFENACTFIEEAVKKSISAKEDPIQWKFAILCLAQAIELSLKERIRREHHAFIFKDINKQTKTISLDESITRLESLCSFQLSNVDKELICLVSKKRNEIVHYEFSIDTKEFQAIFMALFAFLSSFFQLALQESLDSHIDRELWEKTTELKLYIISLYIAAEKVIQDKEYLYLRYCPSCRFHTFVIDDDINTCLTCGHREDVYKCEECQEHFLKSAMSERQVGDEYFRFYCHDCYERICHDELEHEANLMEYYYSQQPPE